MQNTNPLTKYFRQPKIYLSLPSKGEFYPPGSIQGDPSNLPVFGMSAMDEIMFKTPDALFSGEATVQVIRSCIPSITQPWLMPQLDVDAVLIAIRIATYGQSMPSSFRCKKCKEETKFDLDLSRTLDYFVSLDYIDSKIIGPLKINFRPLTYKELTDINVRSYELKRTLSQKMEGKTETQKSKLINKTMSDIAEVQVDAFMKCIASVETDEEEVSDFNQIREWINNADADFYEQIKNHLETQSQAWRIQNQKTICANEECQQENSVEIRMDNSDFFARG
jgi:hypothetical protein